MPEHSLVSLFARSVQQHGDAVAVRDADDEITYRELDKRSDRLAGALVDAGIRPGDRVVVDLSRSIAVPVSLLGILKAGAAYLALDPRTPAARRARMMTDGEVAGVVAEDTSSDLSLPVFAYHEAVDRPGSPAYVPAPAPEDVAAVLFTSGSKGGPKGILLEHRNLVFFATNPGLPALVPTDRVGQISSIAFDAFHWELWATLASGACLVILPDVQDLLADDFQREMRRYQISAVLVPTMVANQVVREDIEAFSALRLVQVGGDVLLPATCRAILDGAFEGELWNLYGPAEITTACTAHRVTAADASSESVPIGIPLSDVTALVQDDSGSELADGEPGELVIGGPGVARGYLGRPELTDEGFVTGASGGRAYRSGDKVRRRPDGVFEFLGRIDDQVKVRGFRVEPDEIERTLRGCPGVHDVAVLAQGEGEDRRLVAFYVAEGLGARPDARGYAEGHLQHYMVPNRFVLIDEIKVTEHGKRDFRELANLADAERQRDEAYVAPSTSVERFLAGVWEELLGMEDIGVAEDFFELGGHSLLVFRMQSRIRKKYDVSLDRGEMFDSAVLRDIAGLVEVALADQHKDR